jgi:hypothetical protein
MRPFGLYQCVVLYVDIIVSEERNVSIFSVHYKTTQRQNTEHHNRHQLRSENHKTQNS